MVRQIRGSEIRIGDCVTMRAEHRRFLTSSTGSDVFKVVGRDGSALVLEGPLDWHPKHRKQRTMGAHQFKKTACPIEHGDTAKHHHATKKSPAQLQREINEVLAHPGAHSYEEAMEALEKHSGVPRGGSLRSGHVPVVPEMTRKTRWSPSVLELLKRHKARVRFQDRLKRFGPGMHEAGLRWTAFVQGAFGHDAVGEGATKEAAARAAVAELPPDIRRHFATL